MHYPPRTDLPLTRSIVTIITLIALAVLTVIPAWPSPPRAIPIRITLVTIVRPDDDTTLIKDASLGLKRAQADFAGRIATTWLPLRARLSGPRAVVEERTSMLSALSGAAGSSDIVLTWGDLLTDAAIAVAKEHPHVRFLLEEPIFLEQLPPNVVESDPSEAEQAFLAGAVAAMYTRSRRIGYLGALPGWQEYAFRAGAYYVNPRVQVIIDYIATTITATGAPAYLPTSWRAAGQAGTSEPGYHDPRKAEAVTLAQFDRQADIIYAAAGASDSGTYRAALLRHGWVIERGGPRSLSRFPDAWRSRNLAMTIERGDLVVHYLISQTLNNRPLRPHVAWRIGDPLLPVPLIGVTVSMDGPMPAAGTTQRLARIIDDLRNGTINVPYGRQQLTDFFKRYAR